MKINPILLDDPLWAKLNNAVELLRRKPGHILFERAPNDQHGLASDEINRLVVEAGLSEQPIFFTSADPQNEPERFFHPEYTSPVEWFRIGPSVGFQNRQAIIDDVAGGLEAWRARRVGQLAAAEQPEADAAPTAAKPDKRATVAARMFDLIQKDTSTHTWTVRQFAEALKCSEGAVHKTKTWKSLNTSREMARQARSEQEYHKNRNRSPAVHK